MWCLTSGSKLISHAYRPRDKVSFTNSTESKFISPDIISSSKSSKTGSKCCPDKDQLKIDPVSTFNFTHIFDHNWPFRNVLEPVQLLSKIQFGSLGELFVSMIAVVIKLKSTIQKQKKSSKNELKITQMLISVPPSSSKPDSTGPNWSKLVQTGSNWVETGPNWSKPV